MDDVPISPANYQLLSVHAKNTLAAKQSAFRLPAGSPEFLTASVSTGQDEQMNIFGSTGPPKAPPTVLMIRTIDDQLQATFEKYRTADKQVCESRISEDQFQEIQEECIRSCTALEQQKAYYKSQMGETAASTTRSFTPVKRPLTTYVVVR